MSSGPGAAGAPSGGPSGSPAAAGGTLRVPRGVLLPFRLLVLALCAPAILRALWQLNTWPGWAFVLWFMVAFVWCKVQPGDWSDDA